MSKELFVSSTPHETKVAVVEEDQLTEIYYERENEYTLAGSIYKGRVTRVLPGMQSAFVNIGLERDAFLYVSDFLLEEEDDTDGLEQVVQRSRPVISDPDAVADANRGPLEAQEIFPEQLDEEDTGEEPSAEAQGEPAGQDDQTREGARKWRGRRRRRGRGGRYDREEQRPAAASQTESPAEPRQEPRPEPVHETRHESHSESRSEHRHDGRHDARHDRQEREPRREGRYGGRHEQEPELEPIVLPGESISKYQPPSAQTATESRPSAPVKTSRPSTEYSIDPSQFTPGSVTLPGESLAKYKGDRPQTSARMAAEPVAERNAPSHESEHGFLQDQASAGPVPHQAKASSQQQGSVTVAALPGVEDSHHEDSHHQDSHQDAAHDEEGDRQAKHETERFAPMKVTPIFTGNEAETEEFEEVEESQYSADAHAPVAHTETEHVAHAAPATTSEAAPEIDSTMTGAPVSVPSPGNESFATESLANESLANEAQAADQPWKATGRGVVEEEVIEEEEGDLPAYEDDLDLGEFEELEEENLVPMGSELTEAVRDAHINEHATGQYEAEGLDEGGDADEEDDFDEEGHPAAQMLDGDAEVDELESGEHTEEGTDGTQTERRTGGGQHQRSDRRPHDRRGRGDKRRPGRRVGGRRPHTPQRQLPAISDLLKEGQEILVQIAKEPIAKKGARITSHIALPGRYLVFMPTVHHTGVSRKIASEEERHRLKRIVTSERGDSTGGFIVRTAAAGANEDDLRADIRFLINLWQEIKGRAESSKAPALIYHDLNLVERILRDQVTTSFSSIFADTEQEYERILRFVSRFQPSLVRRVKLYSKETPLFEQFNITDEVNKALKSKVWLKSGGYIVINQTEALVAIDINTGKYVGKTARLEDTIVKTNLDAIREIVRQIRLRDLGGIIVIDFIDMDERKNRQKVMQALEEALKSDRAPSKVLQFNDFGLVAITRKRVKQSLERTLGQPCTTCQATGMIKSVTTVCNEIYVEMRKMAGHFERDVMLRVHPEVAKALKTNGGKWVQEMEDLTKRTILVKSDPLLHPEQFDIQ
jgi:ribonuclease E